MEGDKKKLDTIALIVHSALRALKMGETGQIACSREFPAAEIIEYTKAYAMHKKKWFTLEHDRVNNSVSATRAPPAPWPVEKVKPEYEEP